LRLARYAWGVRTVLASLALFAASTALAQRPEAASDAPAEEAPARRITVTVITHSDSGRVFCAMWRGREGYPTQRNRTAFEAIDRTIVNHRATCVFEDVPPGEYAIAAFHDENGNNGLDRNFLGIPSEGTGASNDARGFMGPPRYDDARFQFPETVSEARLIIRIGYTYP
jgi:uncharacterized protein (DUF2141 family)